MTAVRTTTMELVDTVRLVAVAVLAQTAKLDLRRCLRNGYCCNQG